MAYEKEHLVDLGGLQTSVESIRAFVDKTISQLPNGHRIVNITSNSDGTYTADVPTSEIIKSYNNGILWFAVYDDRLIIPLASVSGSNVYFANQEYTIIINSNGVDEFFDLNALRLWQRSDGTFYLTMSNHPIAISLAYMFDIMKFGNRSYRKAGEDGSSGWWIGWNAAEEHWEQILVDYRTSSISVSALPGLPVGTVTSDGYVPAWNQTTQQYELKELAGGASAFEVTFTQGATAKELTSDKTMAEIWAAYSDGNIIHGTMVHGGVEYTFTLVGASQTRVVFQQIMSNGVTCVIGDEDKWSWDGFKAQAVENLTTSMSSSSTDIQYPSAKAVYDSLPTLKTWTSADLEAST